MPQQPHSGRNIITDVAGLAVGNWHDARLRSGVTVVMFDRPAVVSCAILGGAPGSRDTESLAPEMLVDGADALVLSGGSAFGLDAASGVQAFLREQGRGFAVGPARVPIVPGAICFDLLNGGDKAWGRYPPYREMAYEAARTASRDIALGSAGAGFGATTVSLRGGLGSVSAKSPGGFTVGALLEIFLNSNSIWFRFVKNISNKMLVLYVNYLYLFNILTCLTISGKKEMMFFKI